MAFLVAWLPSLARLAQDRKVKTLDAPPETRLQSLESRERKPLAKLLARYLILSPGTSHAIRPADEFVCREAGRDKRVLALVEHLFVRYPVPRCLYRAMLSEEGLHLVFPGQRHPTGYKRRLERESGYRRWFRAISRGDSFALVAKDTFTKREAHGFLLSPPENSIEENILWARAAALGVPAEGCEFLLARFGKNLLQEFFDRLPDLFRFYARAWPEMEARERAELADFLRNELMS